MKQLRCRRNGTMRHPATSRICAVLLEFRPAGRPALISKVECISAGADPIFFIQIRFVWCDLIPARLPGSQYLAACGQIAARHIYALRHASVVPALLPRTTDFGGQNPTPGSLGANLGFFCSWTMRPVPWGGCGVILGLFRATVF